MEEDEDILETDIGSIGIYLYFLWLYNFRVPTCYRISSSEMMVNISEFI
jgi:hypothetical protein